MKSWRSSFSLMGLTLALIPFYCYAESYLLVTISLDASKWHPAACSDPEAKGPLTGSYIQESGGKICLLDYGEIVIIPRTEGLFGFFDARFDKLAEGELEGRAYANGYSSSPLITACNFEGPTRLTILTGNKLLWTKPSFRYDNSCCNLLHLVMQQDSLVRAD